MPFLAQLDHSTLNAEQSRDFLNDVAGELDLFTETKSTALPDRMNFGGELSGHRRATLCNHDDEDGAISWPARRRA